MDRQSSESENAGKIKLLFLCTGNACRSQMAEGWARDMRGDVIESHSAGLEARGLDPRAVAVMTEVGIDISGQSSKTVKEVADIAFDYVVTVCDHAQAHCPAFGGEAKVIHVGFDDPPLLATNARSEAEALQSYRRVRDEIKAFVTKLPDALSGR